MPSGPNATTLMVWPVVVVTAPPTTGLALLEKRGSEPSSVYLISLAPVAVMAAECEVILAVHACYLPVSTREYTPLAREPITKASNRLRASISGPE